MKRLIRKDIDRINSYIPGRPIDSTQENNIIKLNSNENAFGSSRLAKIAIKNNLNNIFRYPDGSCYFLKKALSRKLNLRAENLIFGNGSDELIDIIIKTFLNRGEKVITSQTTFAEYEIITKVNGFKVITVPLKEFCYDLEAIKRKITKKTKIIFIANPNNPTGTYITNNALLNFIKWSGNDKLVVVDEAYWEFADAKDFPRLLNYINKANLIIMRTFSKAYGLAGLRIGYVIANPKFIESMEKVRQPFNVNFLAQKAAQDSLSDAKFIKNISTTIIREKYWLYREFDKMEIEYMPSQANFIMFRTEIMGLEFSKRMSKLGVWIRDLKQYNLDNYVRVTIGTPKENKIFIKNLKKIIKIR